MCKKRKILASLYCVVILIFSMSGCFYEQVEMTYDKWNGNFKLSYKSSQANIAGGGKGEEKNGIEYGVFDHGSADELGMIDEEWFLDKLMRQSWGGEDVVIGDIRTKRFTRLFGFDHGEFDYVMIFDIFEGNTPKDFYEKNAFNCQYVEEYREAAERWQNGDEQTRKEIEYKYGIQYDLTLNFQHKVHVLTGSEYVILTGNSAFVDIGRMMADNGGKVVILVSDNGGLDFMTSIKEFCGYDAPAVYQQQKPVEPGNSDVLSQFVDVKKDAWYADAVEYCVLNGKMNGYGNGKFGPNDPVTMAQLSKILYNAKGHDYGHYELFSFGHWADMPFSWALYNGILLDFDTSGDRSLNEIIAEMNHNMTREEAIFGMAMYANNVLKEKAENTLSYTIPDLGKVNQKYQEGVKLAYQYGITNGVDATGRFAPTVGVTRAEVCQMLYNQRW